MAVLGTSGCAQNALQEEPSFLSDIKDLASFSWLSSEVSETIREEQPENASAAGGTVAELALASGRQQRRVATVVERPEVIDLGMKRDAVGEALARAKQAAPDSHDDLWARIRARISLPRPATPAIAAHLRWVDSNQTYFERVAKRAEPYLYYIAQAVEQRRMPGEVALLPILESGFQPFAYSSSGAAGLWQIIPSTGRYLGLKQNWWYDGRRDLLDATDAALDYLERLYSDLDDWTLAFAAYNAGEGTVLRAQARSREAGGGTDFWSIRKLLPAETQAYVPRLLAIAAAVQAPQDHGLSLPQIANRPYFSVVETGGQLELDLAARLASVDTRELQRLNPGFKRWATDPDGPHRLLLPAHAAPSFGVRLAGVAAHQRVSMQRHVIAQGETLGQIARRYGTRTDVLRRVNKLSGSQIRAGSALMVPAMPGAAAAPADTGGGSLDAAAVAAAERATASRRRAIAGTAPQSGTASPASDTTAGSETAPPLDDTRNHIVQVGDSLWSIARRYDTRVATLTAMNALTSGVPLRPGQTLRVPAEAEAATTTTPRPAAATGRTIPVSTSVSRRVYTVQAGDSLWSIARRVGLRVADIRAWNSLPEDATLRPGQQLQLTPPTPPRQS